VKSSGNRLRILVWSDCKLCIISDSVIILCSYDWWRSNKSIHSIQNPLTINHVTHIRDNMNSVWGAKYLLYFNDGAKRRSRELLPQTTSAREFCVALFRKKNKVINPHSTWWLWRTQLYCVRRVSLCQRSSFIASTTKKIFFFICAVGLWVLRPLLAYCTSPGW
jgi:hypothetical protein